MNFDKEEKEKLKNRILKNIVINKSTNCWEWTLSCDNGYGRIKVNYKRMLVHRISYYIYKGYIPDNMFVCHHCDNPKCCNPEHLFLGTPKDNMQDCLKKKRMIIPVNVKNRFIKGHIPKNREISKEKELEIKNFIKNNRNITIKEVSILFNVKYQAIRDWRRKNSHSYKD